VTSERARSLPYYEIRRSTRARRSRITVTEDGVAVVVLPMRAPDSAAADLAWRYQGWINRHVARMRQRRLALDSRAALDSGSRDFRYRGELHRVVVTTSLLRTRSSVEIVPGESILVVRAVREAKTTAEILSAWMRQRARAAIDERVLVRAAEMALAPKSVSVRDQRSRWGSASPRGNLSFSWRLLMCPPTVLDYVVVHELAHLKVSGHSRSFWRLVDRHYPDTARARRWLREHHDEIRHALD
jgi:predicted metal-dependent hydrolase